MPKLAVMPAQERAAPCPGSRRGGPASCWRAGALVAEAALDLFAVSEVEICPWALREGIILRRLDRLRTV